MKSNTRIAFIVDALPAVGGGERTVFTALEIFPQADIFTLVYNKAAFANTPIVGKKLLLRIWINCRMRTHIIVCSCR